MEMKIKDGVFFSEAERGYDYVATIENELDENIYVEFTGCELETIVVPAHDWVTLPTTDDGLRAMEEIENNRIAVVLMPTISRDMLAVRYYEGKIELICNPHAESLYVYQIGELWFPYPGKITAMTTKAEIVDTIYNSLQRMKDDQSLLEEYVYCAQYIKSNRETKYASCVRLVNDLIAARALRPGDAEKTVCLCTDSGWVERPISFVAWELAYRYGEFDRMVDGLYQTGIKVVITNDGLYDHIERSDKG